MLGLAAYSSSSEDEGAAAPPVKQRKLDQPANPTKQGTGAAEDRSVQRDERSTAGTGLQADEKLEDKPMMGPSRPSRSPSPSDDNIEAARAPTSPFSETRTLIRDLTLPPIPNLDIPPSPPGSPDPMANQKFAHFITIKKQGAHFNEKLASSSSLRNPSLMGKLMHHSNIEGKDQYATTLPEDLWNPAALPEWGYRGELLRSQQEIRHRLEAEKASSSRSSIEFVSGSERSRTPASSRPKQSAAERVMSGLAGRGSPAERSEGTRNIERRPKGDTQGASERRSRSPSHSTSR